LAWFATLCWTLYGAWNGNGDNGEVQYPEFRLLQDMPNHDGLAELYESLPLPAGISPSRSSYLSLTELPAAWPSPRFKPRSLACGRDGRCYVANEFLIFEVMLSQQEPEMESTFTHVPCNVTGTIHDLAVACDNVGKCRPLALAGIDTATVVDCAGLELEHELNDAKLLATLDGETIFATSGRTVIQHARRERPHTGWFPLWPVADVRADSLAAIDIVSNAGKLVLFGNEGSVQVKNLDTGIVCGTWLPQDRTLQLLSGTVLASGDSHLALVRSVAESKPPRIFLVRIHLPDMAKVCNDVVGDGTVSRYQLRGSH